MPSLWSLQVSPTLTELHDLSPVSKTLKSVNKKGMVGKKEEKVSGSEDGARNVSIPGLSRDKLLHILKGYGEYPAKYR